MPSNLEKISQHLGPKVSLPPFLAARPETLVPRALPATDKNPNRKSTREVAFDLFSLCVEITSELKWRSSQYENRDDRNTYLVG
ncbi:unnamed protein product [Clonostachys rosea f. rosea IK726]|uniref:Uncharacterized protein n=1 Tax=Clonostachys rosea f. rosea IK726 TaxID=1349383 RepID=A0ACA9TFS2_BIOOC|nr:unnamed protein product [Clonostachys rosea f. rosea IK726]